ncbi:DUF4397 domain-containing protein [Neobacillus sp. MM2021_6]|uniref:DUF4397 domain-containing protein n=1 Tax=Bacillaceae TaxID=186817 RepID=UPI00140A0202|nr:MULTISPECIES: DUF4397 domain-containing protein [Bacillaceae]MBO0958292.1 DUF4397 domain-containing protein [Neobacillus sp. MM2021_6]NHC17892.1 DUF4397 domain-containing protein [Bacillus sp. MM2020_4]
MSETRNQADYLQKAAMYDLLAQYYKYSNPNLHIHFYLKHVKSLNKAMNIMRTNSQLQQGEAKVRLLHTSPDASNVDMYINGNRVIRDLPLKQVSQELTLQPGKYHVDIYPAGNMVDSFLNKKITVEAGKSYTLTTIDSIKKMRLLVFLNEPQVPLNEAKVRFIHLSPDTPPLDIAVKDRDVIFPKITYKQATDYLGLTPMTVDLEARTAGTKEVFLPLPKVQFKANETTTIVFLGLSKGTPEFQFISIKE